MVTVVTGCADGSVVGVMVSSVLYRYIGTRTSVQSERGGDEHDGSPACAFCSRIGRTT